MVRSTYCYLTSLKQAYSRPFTATKAGVFRTSQDWNESMVLNKIVKLLIGQLSSPFQLRAAQVVDSTFKLSLWDFEKYPSLSAKFIIFFDTGWNPLLPKSITAWHSINLDNSTQKLFRCEAESERLSIGVQISIGSFPQTHFRSDLHSNSLFLSHEYILFAAICTDQNYPAPEFASDDKLTFQWAMDPWTYGWNFFRNGSLPGWWYPLMMTA